MHTHTLMYVSHLLHMLLPNTLFLIMYTNVILEIYISMNKYSSLRLCYTSGYLKVR